MSYAVVSDLAELLNALKEKRGEARVVAGATDLFLASFPTDLIDITGLAETTQLETTGELLSIGAAVTHAEAAGSPLIRAGASALAEACSGVGSPQIRNIGTVGGNVINAAPAADAAVALVALGARAVLTDLEGNVREEAVEKLYAGYNQSAVDSSAEVLLRLVFKPCGPNEGTAFLRFAVRKALSLPIVNAAARVTVENGILKEVRLVAAPLKPAPTRLLHTEKMLLGVEPGEKTTAMVETSASAEAEARGSLLRCSEQYRRHLVGVLAGRVISKAIERALAKEGVV